MNILEGLSWQFSDKHGGELTPKKHVFQNTEPYQNNDWINNKRWPESGEQEFFGMWTVQINTDRKC